MTIAVEETPGSQNRELQRLREAYERRTRSIPSQRYARTNPGHLFSLHEREATMAAMLRAEGLSSLAGLRILDLGCGRGATLRQYLEYEADASLMWGIDLFPGFIQQARRSSTGLNFISGSASELPFADGSFDFISQFLLFTSILDQNMKRDIGREIHRVLAPGGHLLWYDFAFNNAMNPDVQGIRLAEIHQLFPMFTMTSRRITLAPPLGRAIAHLGPAIYFFLSKLRPLCTHYLCLLKKN